MVICSMKTLRYQLLREFFSFLSSSYLFMLTTMNVSPDLLSKELSSSYSQRSIKSCVVKRYIQYHVSQGAVYIAGLFQKSAVAYHQQVIRLFQSTSVAAKSSNFVSKKSREAIEILRHPSNINRDAGYPRPSVCNVVKSSIGSTTAQSISQLFSYA